MNRINEYLDIPYNDIMKRYENNIDEKEIPGDKHHEDRRRTQLKKLYNSSRFEKETTKEQKYYTINMLKM